MTNTSTTFQAELVDPSVFIADGAIVLGDVTIGRESSVWFQAVIRGDTAPITIGEQTNIQDGCILHADPGFPCSLGNRVSLGHGAIVHGAQVEDDVMIAMRAVVMNGAVIGSGSIVGVGAVVTEGTIVPPQSIVLGLPGKVIRPANEADWERIQHAASHYVEAAKQYK
jgi:carbonic anhydrase/acetyltransferase-like protein (isoleucine patch superfamily)